MYVCYNLYMTNNRRKNRQSLIKQQLAEIDEAREKCITDMKTLMNPKDVVYAIDALIKVHQAERSLYDEAYVATDMDEADVADLLG